jgi:Na+/H+-dicarboxylate symporter/ABC-type amino acid transport substrate-binding protein
MGLSSRILVGLLLGIATGLFFGEMTAGLKIFGDVFVKLLQMTVLPYIVVSLIAGFGRMTMQQARLLALKGSAVLVVIWLLALALIFIAQLAFPSLEQASFFSSPNYPPAPTGDLVDQYVPANIFYSLSNDLIPAVVLFSILLGVALISVRDKEAVLAIFDGLTEAIARINMLVVQLTPFGIFAIAAAAAGTMTIEELGRVQVYLVTYIALALLVTFWIFPGLVSAVSGIPYREVLSTFKDALMTAFATGNQFVVLPLIAQNCKTLLAKHNMEEENSAASIDVIVPVSFNFPSLGKMLVILYVLFAAWFTDTDVDTWQQLTLAINGLFSLFGSINIAVPYMLDSLQIPIDMFQLFMVTGVVVGRFGAMLAALHIIVLSVIGTLAIGGQLKITARGITRYVLTSCVCVFLLLLGLRFYFHLFVPAPEPQTTIIENIAAPALRVDTKVLSTVPAPATPLPGNRLQEIVQRGVLHVGFRPRNLPCTYLTEKQEVVGFDATMAQKLAEDLGVSLVMTPFRFDELRGQLESGRIDIAMSCIASLPDRYLQASYSRPYLDLKLALIVPDHQRELFNRGPEALRQQNLTIALVGSHYFTPLLKQILPEVGITSLESAEQFFTSPKPVADAMLLSAEEGAAYTFRYPAYTTVLPQGKRIMLPAAYALPRGEYEWSKYIDNWVDLKQKDGTVASNYRFWMDGAAVEKRTPRWSVIRDVLGWVD